jgi:hypothetical protein
VTDDQWLREHLTSSVPEPPTAPGRADAARRRARAARRRTAAVVAAACAVAVVAVAAPLAIGGSGSPEPAVTDPTTDAPTPEPTDLSCPAPEAKPTGPGVLPEGAVAVRLCDGPGIGFDEPEDALVSGVEELVRVVNAQEVTGPPRVCTTDLGTGYLLAFEYPGGTVRSVTGELYGCNTLVVGTSVRANPEIPWHRFLDLLRAQRAATSPPSGLAVRPSCAEAGFTDQQGGSPLGRPDDMTNAVLCVRYQTATEHAPLEVDVPESDLEVLLADRAAREHPAEPAGDCGPATPSWQLAGRTRWGDLTAVDSWCGQWSDERGHYWRPGADAQRILDRLVTEAGRPAPTVDAGSSAEDVVAAYVDLLNAGDRSRAAALWHPVAGPPDLPTTYSRVDYKVEGVKSLPRISAWRDATLVRALYREQVGDVYVPYREASFTLGRDEEGVFRIVGMQLGDVVETGR